MKDGQRANLCCESCLPSLLELHQSNLALQEEMNQIKYSYNSIRLSQEIKSIIFNSSHQSGLFSPANKEGPKKLFKHQASPHNQKAVSSANSLKSNSFLQNPESLTERNLRSTPRGNVNLSSPDVIFSRTHLSNAEKVQQNTVPTNTSTNMPTSPEDLIEKKRELIQSVKNNNEYSLFLKRHKSYMAMLGRPSPTLKENFRFSDSIKKEEASTAKSIQRQLSLKSEELKGKLREIHGSSSIKEYFESIGEERRHSRSGEGFLTHSENKTSGASHQKNSSFKKESGKRLSAFKSNNKRFFETPEHNIEHESVKQVSVGGLSAGPPLSPLGLNDLKLASEKKGSGSSFKLLQGESSGKSKGREFKFPISSPVLNNIIVSARKNYYNNFSSVSNNKTKPEKYSSVSESSFRNESNSESTPSKKVKPKPPLSKNLESRFQEVENYEKNYLEEEEEEEKSLISHQTESFLSSGPQPDPNYPQADADRLPKQGLNFETEAPEEMFESCVRLKDGQPVEEGKRGSANEASEGLYVYKIVSFHEGRYISTFDGETEYVLGRAMERAFHRDEEGIISGGFSAHPTIASAIKTRFPSSSRLLHNPRILLKLRVEGPTLKLSPNSLAVAKITPVEALFVGDQL